MAKQLLVNLAVKDLQRSVDFYKQLGFAFDPRFTDDNGTCMIVGEDAFVMLLAEPFFEGFTTKPLVDATAQTEALMAVSCESREAVDDMVRTALGAGGSEAKEVQDHGFMYGWSFQDPDGHHWEPFYMDESAIPE